MRSTEEQSAIRLDVFRWLDEQLGRGAYELSRADLEAYEYGGERIPLIDRTRGIRNPRDFDATLSILTSSQPHGYADSIEPGGLIRYSYQSKEGGDNVKLRRALAMGVPLVYFQGVRPNWFVAHYPVHVVGEDAQERFVKVAMDDAFEWFADPIELTGIDKRYAVREVKQRLHQPLFRARVLSAYETACSICSLGHAQLLDAAHIIPDADESGVADVVNGIALCKLHHAAFDANLLGVDPDYTVHMSPTLMAETGSSMFQVALQNFDGHRLQLPRVRAEWPLREALAARFDAFTQAAS